MEKKNTPIFLNYHSICNQPPNFKMWQINIFKLLGTFTSLFLVNFNNDASNHYTPMCKKYNYSIRNILLYIYIYIFPDQRDPQPNCGFLT
jgi:hypothetical protein